MDHRMPPRHAFYTILIDEQPTAFRAANRDDLQPTFKRLREKHPTARMVWFQNGKIWNTRLDAQEAMRVRGERGRAGDFRQGNRERREGKLEWKPREKLQWKPKSEVAQKPKLEWRPKGAPGTRHEAPKRDRSWRPGGEHRDPRQKYKDAKKAKWTRFKQNVRKRWESKQDRRKKDEE
jgi:hypothetical protein